MKISKITKILPLVLALSMCCAYAEGTDESTTANVNYQLTLDDYIRISTTDIAALTSTTTFDPLYAGIKIDTDMVGDFNVISNAKARTLELTASCPVVGTASPLYGAVLDGDVLKEFNLVFTHTTEIPADTSVKNITGGTPAVDSNPNAVAFTVKATQAHDHGPSEGPLKASWDSANQKVVYTMKNGVADLTFTIGGKNVGNTFNTQDQSGTYKSTLILTDAGLITEGSGS